MPTYRLRLGLGLLLLIMVVTTLDLIQVYGGLGKYHEYKKVVVASGDYAGWPHPNNGL
jgi:hypothetical protein